MRKKNSRFVKKNVQLLNKLNELQTKMKEISHSNLQNIIENSNIPKSQIDLIYEIFNASKMKNPKNRRYSENWMILCLLFQIRFYIFITYLNIIGINK